MMNVKTSLVMCKSVLIWKPVQNPVLSETVLSGIGAVISRTVQHWIRYLDIHVLD